MPADTPGEPLPPPLAADLAAVASIDAVPRILEVVCRATGMGFSAVARVTDEKWVACAVRDEIAFGLGPGGELELASTICDEIRQSGELVVIDDVDADPHFACHHTPRKYGFKSYISVPIVLPDGQFFGTLCALHPHPARLDRPEVVEMFKLFADLIAQHLEARRRVAVNERALDAERAESALREQFIAVLGHDLRNPLGSISQGTFLMEHLPPGPDLDRVREMVKRSVARMTRLIEDVLDFARGRLGGGVSLDRRPVDDLAGVLEQVVHELEVGNPGRVIERDFALDRPVVCDPDRLAQLVSNLVFNALTHGNPATPVRASATVRDGTFELAVCNRGPAIPPAVAATLFEPFARGQARAGQAGLGLGLYIAAQVARGHGGTLTVESADGETCFTLRMPAGEAPPGR